MNADFKKNPKWILKFTDFDATPQTDLQITLKRPYYDWTKQCRLDLVGSMMGFYIFRGDKPVRNGDIFHEGKPWNESPFVPLHQVQTPPSFRLPPPTPEENNVYTIVPTTFDPGKTGPFFLSVISNKEFTLRKDIAKCVHAARAFSTLPFHVFFADHSLFLTNQKYTSCAQNLLSHLAGMIVLVLIHFDSKESKE